MAEPLRHRQTKEAATDMFSLQSPRHIPNLPKAPLGARPPTGRFTHDCGLSYCNAANWWSGANNVWQSALLVE